jgi:beta-mannosidase
VLLTGRKTVALRYGESVNQKTLDLTRHLAKHSRDCVYLRFALDINGRCVSEDSVFFAPPRFIALPKLQVKTAVTLMAPQRASITFTASAFQHRFAFELDGIPHRSSDNYFELFAGEPKVVEVDLGRPQTIARLEKALKYRSLSDTY